MPLCNYCNYYYYYSLLKLKKVSQHHAARFVFYGDNGQTTEA